MSLLRGSQMMRKHRASRKSFVFAFEPSESADLVTRQKRHLSFLAGVLGLSILVLGGGIYTFSSWYFGQSDRDYVYFELKVVDQEGHPISGAELSHHQQQIGVTDSFGEWRRFLRVDLGQAYSLKVSKNYRGEDLAVIKNFAIPVRASLDEKAVEVSGRILLASHDVKQSRDERIASATWKPVTNTNLQQNRRRDIPGLANLRSPMEIVAEVPSTTQGVPEIKAVWTYQISNLSGWAQEDRKRATYVRSAVMKALQDQTESLMAPATVGNWAIHVRHLPVPEQNGLLLVESRADDPRYNFSLLKNYLPGAERTATALRSAIARMLNQLESNESPVFGWREYDLQARGSAEMNGLTVYAGGYLAKHLGQGKFKYWGPEGRHSNITMVSDGKVVHRERIKNTEQGAARIAVGYSSKHRM